MHLGHIGHVGDHQRRLAGFQGLDQLLKQRFVEAWLHGTVQHRIGGIGAEQAEQG